MKHFLHKLLNKQNLTKLIIIFFAGLLSRYLVNSYYNINVFIDFKDYISILYYSCMAIFTVFVHQYVEHFNISFIPQRMIDLFDKPISLNKLQDGPITRTSFRNHTSSNSSNSNSNETEQIRRSRNRRINNSTSNTESNTRHSSTNKQIVTKTDGNNMQSQSQSNIVKVRDNTMPPSSYYRINTLDAYRHQLKYSNRVVVTSPIMANNTVPTNENTELIQHFNHNGDSFANRMLRKQSIITNNISNNTDMSVKVMSDNDTMIVPIAIDNSYPQTNDNIGTNNGNTKHNMAVSPNPLNFVMSMDNTGNIILQKDHLHPLNTANSSVSNKSEGSSGVRRLLGERKTRVFEGIKKPGFETLVGYSDKEVIIPKKGLGDRLLLGFRSKMSDAASKIDSIYIKYYDGGRRKFLWTIWEKNRDNYATYQDFKANWDPKSSVWRKISDEIKHDISEEVRNLVKTNNPFENKKIQTGNHALLKELGKYKRK